MILAIDQGTTGTTVLLYQESGELLAKTYREHQQYFPQAAWVEHDPEEIWQNCLACVEALIADTQISIDSIKAIGITNQRETTVLWDRVTGKAVLPAIVWQCRRSADICQRLKQTTDEAVIIEKTGLRLDPYFSASKLQWIFETHPELLQRARAGELCFGTIDSWLIYKLSGGRAHLTDPTNASRTLLYNINEQQWDEDLLQLFGIPRAILPTVLPSSGLFSDTHAPSFFNAEIPIYGVAGDQQAALFGQQCTEPGAIKNTYGTGCFMLMYCGEKRPTSASGLLTTIACDIKGQAAYALEGAVFSAGSIIQWLRDQLNLIKEASETEALANSLADNAGVYMVPAFNGLGAPYWDMDARASIIGLSSASGKAHIIRAALEAIAYQSHELAQLMQSVSAHTITSLKVDGGASNNNFLMQFQADIMNVELQRPSQVESTALGAALLAGIGLGIWQADKLPPAFTQSSSSFSPKIEDQSRERLLTGWHKAVTKTLLDTNSD